MNPTKNPLPEAARAELAVCLNGCLANLIGLKLRAKQAHWNLRGPGFATAHSLFEEIAGIADTNTDVVAERIVALGSTADGTVTAIMTRSVMQPYPPELRSVEGHLEMISDCLAVLCSCVRLSIETALEYFDQITADILIAAGRDIEKYLWLTESNLP